MSAPEALSLVIPILFPGRDISYKGEHVLHVDGLIFHLIPDIWNIVLQHREKEHGGDSGGEAAVVQDQPSVEGAGGAAYGGAHETSGDSRADAIAAHNGAEAHGEGHAGDVPLGGQRPGNLQPIDQADTVDHRGQKLVAKEDGPHISRMLPHGGEGEAGQHNPHGRAGVSGPLCKMNGQVEIQKKQGPVAGDVDEAQGHSVFVREIAGVSGILHQVVHALKAFSV